MMTGLGIHHSYHSSKKLCELLAVAQNDLKEKPEWQHRCVAMLVVAETLRTNLEELEDEINSYFAAQTS